MTYGVLYSVQVVLLGKVPVELFYVKVIVSFVSKFILNNFIGLEHGFASIVDRELVCVLNLGFEGGSSIIQKKFL